MNRHYKMYSKHIISIVFLLLISSVHAAPSAIHVVNFEYDEGDVNILDKFTTIGYHPSYKNQPDAGYLLQTKGKERSLYTLTFLPPGTEYTDGHENGRNLGEVIRRENYHFSLTIPSIPGEERIEVYDPEKRLLDTSLFEQESNTLLYVLISIFFIVVIALFFYIKSRNVQL